MISWLTRWISSPDSSIFLWFSLIFSVLTSSRQGLARWYLVGSGTKWSRWPRWPWTGLSLTLNPSCISENESIHLEWNVYQMPGWVCRAPWRCKVIEPKWNRSLALNFMITGSRHQLLNFQPSFNFIPSDSQCGVLNVKGSIPSRGRLAKCSSKPLLIFFSCGPRI